MSPGEREKRNAASPDRVTQGESVPRHVRVLAAVIRRDGRWLVCRRPAHKRHGGLWEFPGGKLDPGESLLDAARRELREELGIDVVRVGGVRYAAEDPGSHFIIEFVDVEISGDPHPLEHDELRWADATELGTLALAPSDRDFVDAHLTT